MLPSILFAPTTPGEVTSLNCGRKFESVKQQGIETRNGKSGDRIGHDHIDVVERNACPLRRFDGDFLKEIERMPAERFGYALPNYAALNTTRSVRSCTGTRSLCCRRAATVC